jgi:uncharacterized membrane protein
MLGSWSEILITTTGFAVLILYHMHLIYKAKTDPMNTSVGMTNRLRRDWVEVVMRDNRDILAVQTLRNWVMASSFLASAAVLIGLGLIGAAFRADKIADVSHVLNIFGTTNQTLWMIKLLVLIVDLFFAFFNFTLSIRYYNHASFAINIPSSQDPIVTYDAVAKIINHGHIHYTMGMRGFYLSVPLTLWLFGPSWLLASSIALVIILYRLDRTL